MGMSKAKDLSPETLNAQALHHVDRNTGAVSPAIHPSSTFVRYENYQLINTRHSYGRAENPGDQIVAPKIMYWGLRNWLVKYCDTWGLGLPSHPGHELAKRQMDDGFGGMMCIQVKGGADEALRVVKRCNVFTRATVFGDVESLIEHRCSMIRRV